MTSTAEPVVAIIDDEPQIRELFAEWLPDRYRINTASGDAALEVIDNDVDAIILDRRMPGMSGEMVLRKLRDRGIDAMVGMASAVEPTMDITDLPFDDYAIKPLGKDDIRELTDSLLFRAEFDGTTRRTLRVASKIAVLEQSRSTQKLTDNEEYQRLKSEFQALLADADEMIEKMIDEEIITNADGDF